MEPNSPFPVHIHTSVHTPGSKPQFIILNQRNPFIKLLTCLVWTYNLENFCFVYSLKLGQSSDVTCQKT